MCCDDGSALGEGFVVVWNSSFVGRIHAYVHLLVVAM